MFVKSNVIKSLQNFSVSIKENATMLSEIDAKFGDGDHGITMTKVANVVDEVLENKDNLSTKEIFATIATKTSKLSGGAAIPLWYMFFEGLSKPIEGDDLSCDVIKKMFAASISEISVISG